MPELPEYPNWDEMEKQASELSGGLGLNIADAQARIAREYGFPEWQNLRNYVDWSNSRLSTDRKDVIALWLHKAYGHDTERADPLFAAKRLAEIPDFVQGDIFLACAIGDDATVQAAIAADPSCVNRIDSPWRCPGCKRNLGMPPLIAVTHSTLVRLPEFRAGLRRCARLLLDAGADPNQTWKDRETDHPLSALYGAAGKNHDAELTRMLLEAGANSNDGESIYHAVESEDRSCLQLLLEAGGRVEGSNALHHQLDRDNLEGLRLLLRYTKDPDDRGSDLGSPLLWAIRRGRSRAHIEALLEAGANPRVKTKDGLSAYRFALQFGLSEAAAILRRAGGEDALTVEDEFVAACASCNESEARRILASNPDIFSRLSESQLRQLPNLTEARKLDAVRLMVELGWPIAVRGGDWSASALNLAVYQGDPELTRFLLDHGASWTERHGFDGDAAGILAWASTNRQGHGDFAGCARVLVEHGMPIPQNGHWYSNEVAALFRELRQTR